MQTESPDAMSAHAADCVGICTWHEGIPVTGWRCPRQEHEMAALARAAAPAPPSSLRSWIECSSARSSRSLARSRPGAIAVLIALVAKGLLAAVSVVMVLILVGELEWSSRWLPWWTPRSAPWTNETLPTRHRRSAQPPLRLHLNSEAPEATSDRPPGAKTVRGQRATSPRQVLTRCGHDEPATSAMDVTVV